MALWVVRAGRRGEREDLALEQGLVVIGWEELSDLSSIQSREQLLALLESTYPDEKKKTLLNWQSQIWPFLHGIEAGDLVALPLKSRSAIALGDITGPYAYRPDLPRDARHTHPVKWVKELPRSDFDQDLLYSLGAFMTVCRVKRNNAEERVRAILTGKRLKPSPAKPEEEAVDWEPPADIEQYARDQIRAYIGQKFKGHALARLVAAVLQAEGHKVHVSPEGPDKGVDIIAGHGAMGFDSPRLVVQVKSESGLIDVKVLRELQGVMKDFRAEHGLLVAWGGYKQSVPKEAARSFFEMRLWDADDLIQAVEANYEKLPEALQAELPLKRVWTLVLGEE